MSGFALYYGAGKSVLVSESQLSGPATAMNVNKVECFPSVPAVVSHLGYAAISWFMQYYFRGRHIRTADQLHDVMLEGLAECGERLIREVGDPMAGAMRSDVGDAGPGWRDDWVMAAPDRVVRFMHHSKVRESDGSGEYVAEAAPQGILLTMPAHNGAFATRASRPPDDANAFNMMQAMRAQNPESRMGGDVVRWTVTRDGLATRVIGTLPPMDERGGDGDFERDGKVLEPGAPFQVFTQFTATSEPSAPAPAAGAKVGRNAPCPCGSGRKAKRCCHG
jgi:hypothetical protein